MSSQRPESWQELALHVARRQSSGHQHNEALRSGSKLFPVELQTLCHIADTVHPGVLWLLLHTLLTDFESPNGLVDAMTVSAGVVWFTRRADHPNYQCNYKG
eukprot:GHUV01050404.1.p3 GENE.GHUV01050404.1~~GHUV01050404.1.p3  ORF type:complete len:102 (-),score=19.99 GHUV01050404.1:33-338(-)